MIAERASYDANDKKKGSRAAAATTISTNGLAVTVSHQSIANEIMIPHIVHAISFTATTPSFRDNEVHIIIKRQKSN